MHEFVLRLVFPFLNIKQICLLREVCKKCTYADYTYLREIMLNRKHLNTFRTKVPVHLKNFLKNPADGLNIYLEGNKTMNYAKKLVKCDLINRLHQLDIKDSDINDISFLEKATQLCNLKIMCHIIHDLTPISSLKLVNLDLSDNSPRSYSHYVYVSEEAEQELDLSPIAKIKTLRTLNLRFTCFFQHNYDQLRGIALDDLNISNTPLKDASLFLNVKKLNLQNTCITSVSDLGSSTLLTELNISGTPAWDIFHLKKCATLRKLTLGYYKEFIVATIELTQLTHIYFDTSCLYRSERDNMATVTEQKYILECLNKIKAQTELVDLYSKKIHLHPALIYNEEEKKLISNPYRRPIL